MRSIKLVMLSLLLSVLSVGCGEEVKETISLTELSENEADEQRMIYVYVCGAVVNEGIYELPEGSRVYEVIEMAGGLKEDAAKEAINQAAFLEDGMQLYIPTIHEETQSNKVNLNKATKEQLLTLPGVGEARAETIIQYRKEKGPFRKIEDIMNVTGIKEGLFEKIKDLITI